MTAIESDIKSMKLYQNFERVDREIAELDLKKDEQLQPKHLYPFDNMHYFGVEAVKEALEPILKKIRNGRNDTSEVKVLDVGAGLGGPARYMASELNCKVTAVELQKDCNEKAASLTKTVGLGHKISHVHGDLLKMSDKEIGTNDYELIASWLVFLHINDKEKLFKICNEQLASNSANGSYMCFEDFYKRKEFNEIEKKLLKDEVFCEDLPTKEEYIEILTKCGFQDIEFQDMTEKWADFVHDRFQKYDAQKERHIRVHNEGTFNSQRRFFEVMDKLYSKGIESNLGGVRITCRKAN